MARRRKISLNKRSRRKQVKDHSTAKRKRMLDMGKASSFNYRLRIMLDGVEGGDPIIANINSKSMNIGIEDANNYIEDKINQGTLKREKADEIIELLKRFSKLR